MNLILGIFTRFCSCLVLRDLIDMFVDANPNIQRYRDLRIDV